MWLDDDLCPTDDLVITMMEQRIMTYFDDMKIFMSSADEKQHDYFSSKKMNMLNNKKMKESS